MFSHSSSIIFARTLWSVHIFCVIIPAPDNIVYDLSRKNMTFDAKSNL
jgi:hypothetical protein